MTSIQGNPTPVQARARELLAGLPQDADAEGRIQAASTAVDTLEREFPGSPEAATLKMVRALVKGTERSVTRETLLNAGLELCQKGAVAGSSFLGGAALELSRSGWDDSDKDRLVGACYDHLRGEGALPQPPRMLKLAEKFGDLPHLRDILEDTASGTVDQPGLAARFLQHGNGEVIRLAEGLLDHLAQDGPPELRGAYGLAQTMNGSWFRKLDEGSRFEIMASFLKTPMRSPAEAPARAGEAVSVTRDYYEGSRDLLKAGHRALEALEPQMNPADRARTAMARKLAELVYGSYAQRILGEALKQMGQASEVTGPFAARAANSLIEASGYQYGAVGVLTAACLAASEVAPEGRYKAALRDLGKLLPHTTDYGHSPVPLLAFLRATDELAKGLGDPVEAVVRAISGVGDSGDPAGVIGDFLAGHETGALKNNALIRELLAVLAEDGPAPQMRATARFVYRAMERGELKEGLKSMREAFEIEKMARAGEETNPNAIQMGDEQVQIGGVVIRRKTEA